jgi:hypothetical protein
VKAILLVAALFAADLSPDAKRWWSHVEYLADDKLEGRDTGSAGHRMAVQYVSQEFERAGLAPGGVNGYVQPVGFHVKRLNEDNSKLELIRGGQTQAISLGKEAIIGLRSDPLDTVEAPLVFAGSALLIPEKGIDDLKGLDVKGKVVVTLARVPEGLSTEEMAFYGLRTQKTLVERGAVGMVTIPNPKRMDIPWARSARARFLPSMSLSDPSMDDGGRYRVTVTWNPEFADALLAGSGHTIAELLALADAKKNLPTFTIPASIRVKQAVDREQVESQNVVGVLKGSDPKLANEFIVVSAHIDHVGKSKVIEGDGIHNGAMDNASGIASMIEMARMFQQAKVKPRRSIAFVAVTGEEKGLQGSRYFAKKPSIPGQMVANVNMDMFLPLHPLKIVTVLGLNESTLGPMFREVAEKAGVKVQTDPQPERSLFTRSDQFNFVRRGVPAIATKFGFEPDSPEAALHKAWLTDRYHAPSDDLDQPVDKEAAALFTKLMYDFTAKVAAVDERPRWRDTSVFKKFEKEPN